MTGIITAKMRKKKSDVSRFYKESFIFNIKITKTYSEDINIMIIQLEEAKSKLLALESDVKELGDSLKIERLREQ